MLETDRSGAMYSFDRDGKRMRMIPGVTTSIYAVRDGRPVFEVAGSDFSKLVYSASAKAFLKTGEDTRIYHLDSDGNRDSQTDPYTGMAFVKETVKGTDGRAEEKIMVWPVTVIRDRYGMTLARNKKKTSRIATIHANTPEEYVSGTYDASGAGSFEKRMNPVLDGYGQALYYQQSDERYVKSRPVYDRDGDFVYDRYDDNLEAFNRDAYRIKDRQDIFDKGILWDETDNRSGTLSMRQGDHYILENTWISGDRTPNDPFHTEPTFGQADMLKRVIPGTYILEEEKAPSGYSRAMPVALTVGEVEYVQRAEMVNGTVKVEITKADIPEQFGREKKGAYRYGPVPGARLALYRAKKQYTDDFEHHPNGWYLVKADEEPFVWIGRDRENHPVVQKAEWTTGEGPIWLERFPPGMYLLEETEAPSGYVRARQELVVRQTADVQPFLVPNDHTKLEIFKYRNVNGQKIPLPNRNAATLGLFAVRLDEAGQVVWREERPLDSWTTNDCSRYTSLVSLTPYESPGWIRSVAIRLGFVKENVSGFEHDFEAMYREYGDQFDELHWYYTEEKWDGVAELPSLYEGIARKTESKEADRTGCVIQLWETAEGETIRISISPERGLSVEQKGVFEYQYHYRELDKNAVSYDTSEGFHRIDYIPWQGAGQNPAVYQLMELNTPEGYEPADPKLVFVKETAEVQFAELENVPVPKEDEPEIPPEETPEETRPDESETEPTLPEESSVLPKPSESPGGPEQPELPETAPQKPSPGGTPDKPEVEIPENPPVLGYISGKYLADNRMPKGMREWRQWWLSKTGDTSLAWIWMIVLCLSGIGLVCESRRRRHEKKKRENGGRSNDHLDRSRSDSDDRCP